MAKTKKNGLFGRKQTRKMILKDYYNCTLHNAHLALEHKLHQSSAKLIKPVCEELIRLNGPLLFRIGNLNLRHFRPKVILYLFHKIIPK